MIWTDWASLRRAQGKIELVYYPSTEGTDAQDWQLVVTMDGSWLSPAGAQPVSGAGLLGGRLPTTATLRSLIRRFLAPI